MQIGITKTYGEVGVWLLAGALFEWSRIWPQHLVDAGIDQAFHAFTAQYYVVISMAARSELLPWPFVEN